MKRSVGCATTLRDEGHGPSLTPPPEFIYGRDHWGGGARLTTVKARAASAPVQRFGWAPGSLAKQPGAPDGLLFAESTGLRRGPCHPLPTLVWLPLLRNGTFQSAMIMLRQPYSEPDSYPRPSCICFSARRSNVPLLPAAWKSRPTAAACARGREPDCLCGCHAHAHGLAMLHIRYAANGMQVQDSAQALARPTILPCAAWCPTRDRDPIRALPARRAFALLSDFRERFPLAAKKHGLEPLISVDSWSGNGKSSPVTT